MKRDLENNTPEKPLRVLAIEPYYGGSHQYFLDCWQQHSCHDFARMTLPAYKWRWRMRHGPIHFASAVRREMAEGRTWDLLFCSDMLDLATFLGLVPELRGIRTVIYFHENQLTYPMQIEKLRDYHCVFVNFSAALAADEVWFNSAFHMNEFLEALPAFLKKMPDYQPLADVETIRNKSSVFYPGVQTFPARKERTPSPLKILWCARWEFDKNPETFFAALSLLKKRNVDFSLYVLGEQFRNSPAIFESASKLFSREIRQWGWVDRDRLLAIMQDCDLVVSTANHEFFGLSIMEAVSAGSFPLLPRRLAYPELFADQHHIPFDRFFYDGTEQDLANRLYSINERILAGHSLWDDVEVSPQQLVAPFQWAHVSEQMDKRLLNLSL